MQQYMQALLCESVINVCHDIPAGPAEATERLWYRSPPLTGLVASAGAIEREKRKKEFKIIY